SPAGCPARRSFPDSPSPSAKARSFVRVDHADGLHERLADRRPDESETVLLEVLAHRLRRRERPDVAVERAVLATDGEEGAGVGDRRLDLATVPNDAGIVQQTANLRRRIARDLLGVEAIEGLPVRRALAEDRRPGQPGLGALDDQAFEQPGVVVPGHAPLGIVLADVEGALGPAAGATAGGHAGTGGHAGASVWCVSASARMRDHP